jgi:hypothetical protein
MILPLSGSWKTSLAGIITILGGLLALAKAGQSGTITPTDLTVAATSITTGIGLIFSRDNNVSSEVAGVTPQQLAAKQALATPSSTPTTTVIAHTPAAPIAPAPATPPTP